MDKNIEIKSQQEYLQREQQFIDQMLHRLELQRNRLVIENIQIQSLIDQNNDSNNGSNLDTQSILEVSPSTVSQTSNSKTNDSQEVDQNESREESDILFDLQLNLQNENELDFSVGNINTDLLNLTQVEEEEEEEEEDINFNIINEK